MGHTKNPSRMRLVRNQGDGRGFNYQEDERRGVWTREDMDLASLQNKGSDIEKCQDGVYKRVVA